MADVQWSIDAIEFTNCNCAYGCPCQFNALPTHGFCEATTGFEIKTGQHGDTKLEGKLGAKGPALRLKTSYGTIRLRKGE